MQKKITFFFLGFTWQLNTNDCCCALNNLLKFGAFLCHTVMV